MISPVRSAVAPLRLVPMKREDVPAVAAMEERIFGPREAWPAAEFASYLRRSGIVASLAMLGGHPVGYVLAHVDGSSANVDSVGVLPEARGRGVGEALMRHALGGVRSRGAQECTLQVRAHNAGARRIYERLGFRDVGALPGYYGPGVDGVQMHL